MISWQQRYNKLSIFSCTNKADQVPFFFLSLEKKSLNFNKSLKYFAMGKKKTFGE